MAGLSQDNFLTVIKGLVTGGGVRGSQPAADAGFLKDISLTPQSIATTGTRATAENSVPADVIILDADDEDAIVNFTVPRDYDEATDHLKVVLLVAYVSGTSIALQADSVSKSSPSEVVADLTTFTAATATTINSAFSIGEVEADLSSLTTERHDNLSVNFVVSATTGVGIGHVIGARVEYRSCLVSYDDDSGSTVLR